MCGVRATRNVVGLYAALYRTKDLPFTSVSAAWKARRRSGYPGVHTFNMTSFQHGWPPGLLRSCGESAPRSKLHSARAAPLNLCRQRIEIRARFKIGTFTGYGPKSAQGMGVWVSR